MQGNQYPQNHKRKDELLDSKSQPFLPFEGADIRNADFSCITILLRGIHPFQIQVRGQVYN